jgi:site-specific DNA-methyltransferase (adenine-specific)
VLATEADVVRSLRDWTYTLDELYARCARQADIERDGGRRPPTDVHPTDTVWKRRVRGALQALKASGRAVRVEHGVWVLRGSRQRPERLLLILPGGALADFQLRLKTAVGLLGELDEPADLVVTDPPYGLRRGTDRSSAARVYARDATKVVTGYRDIDPDAYEEFTLAWVAAAAGALRHAGQLAVITGPQQAAIVQYAAQHAGMTWVSSIAAFREFALRNTRQPACSHWTVTVMCRGALEHPRRVFHTPGDLPKSRSGLDYPLDWWEANGRADRPGLLRYDNGLPLRLVERIVTAFSDRDEHVVDPFVGGGTTAIAAHRTRRRFTGGDINPHALRFTAARLLDEHIWPEQRQPALFELAA